MISSMNAMVTPIAIRQLVATRGARTPRPVPSAGPQAPAGTGLAGHGRPGSHGGA